MGTYSVKAKDLQHSWHVIDAEGMVLGRLATQVASLLLGKHKPMYAPHLDNGDHVIVVNAAKVRLTGKKAEQKSYIRHSGYPGGLKVVSFTEMMQRHPTRVVEKAVRGMLPHNALGEARFRKLKVYAGPTHPHAAQLAESVKKEGVAEAQAEGQA
ncbi:MAG: 50S ribosomal protein L13 [Chloroflexi bacterium]|nr:50S ribosomal protein L13 [Chloroflexota bacterium]